MAQRIKWSQLAHFRAVGRFQHVTKAARHLGVSQPALSRAIANLESDMGVPLFDHLGRSVRLTADGEVFLAYVDRAFGIIEDGFEALRDRHGPGRGTVSIGFLRTLGYNFIPQLVSRFREINPDVQVSLVQNNSAGLEEEMRQGRLDLVFVARIADTSAFSCQKLATQELGLLVPTSHRFANRDSVALPDVKDDAFVCFKAGHALRDLVDGIFQAAGFEPRISFECDDGSYLMGFVAAGLGIALVPPNYIQADGVKALRISSPDARRDVNVAWPTHRYINKSAQMFLEFAKSSILPDMSLRRPQSQPGTPEEDGDDSKD